MPLETIGKSKRVAVMEIPDEMFSYGLESKLFGEVVKN
ncbi:hypothetical protein BBR47_46890 [Brevibacillus brevis NBRC 100599]|uniref:Uncharacterized protein n=1 Tax=Brevibacillus brevis (strain 47 / JCM 6285 / NBRC 100599) TaxID=358681 RepID=C0ZKI9_BREBN|nr:hypothetical protein BBR47_46890 [Brevibacillus brevis NBRC 100599]